MNHKGLKGFLAILNFLPNGTLHVRNAHEAATAAAEQRSMCDCNSTALRLRAGTISNTLSR